MQLRVALGATFLLGLLWGYISVDHTTHCVLVQNHVGVIVHVNKRTPSTTQYRVHTKSDCTLLVTTNRWPEFFEEDEVEITGKVEPISQLPGEFRGYATYLDRKGVDGTARFATVALLHSGDRRSVRSTQMFQQALLASLSEPGASVAQAMLLGERGNIPDELTQQFQRTGLSHIVAISGMHISILIGLVLFVMYLFPVPGIVRVVLVLAITWGYVGLLRYPVSATRAALFWSAVLLAYQARSLISLATVFVIVASVLISQQPAIILDVSFQLSFVAVAGIGIGLFLVRPYSKYWSVLVVPLAAALATLPIVSYHFGMISTISTPANMLAVPAVPVFLVLSLTAASVYVLVPVIGITLGIIATYIWQWIKFVALLFSRIPFAALSYTMPLWMVYLWYGIMLLIAMNILAYQKRRWREVWE